MGLFGMLARGYVIDRLLHGSRPQRRGYGGAYPRRSPYRSSGRRGRFGMFGPMPYYSTRTRGGSSVRVGGCCLPIPLAMVATSAAAVAARRRLG